MAVYPGSYTQYWNYRATAPRRVKPYILAAIHITDNSALMSAMNEAIYSNRVGSGASFTFVNNRNGTTVQCLHPEYQIPFTNGAWRYPNRNLTTVNYSLSHGVGANDATFMTIENVGYEANGYGLSAAQIEKCAQMCAYYSKRTGIAINRNTVLGHRDYDSINRRYCPTRYNLDTLLGKIITRANQIKYGTTLPNTSTAIRATGVPMAGFTNRTGWKATIRAGKPRRSAATTTASNYGNTDSNGENIPIWGEVVGEDMGKYGLPGGKRWFFAPQFINNAWRSVYVPYCDLTNRNF